MIRFVDYTLNGITFGLIYSAVALSLVLIWRATRVINFAQGGLATLSTYIGLSAIEGHASYWLALLLILVAGALIGAVSERLLVRWVEEREPLAPVVVTIGMLVMAEALAGLIWGGQYRSFPANFSQAGFVVAHHRIAFSRFDLFIAILVLGVMILMGLLFRFTRTGLKMRATALARTTARLLGVNVNAYIMAGWALASALGALSCALISPKLFLYPNNMDAALIYGFTAAILGGLESAVGAVVGGVVTGLVTSYVGGYLGSSLETMGALVLLLVVLLLRPQGLFSRAVGRRV